MGVGVIENTDRLAYFYSTRKFFQNLAFEAFFQAFAGFENRNPHGQGDLSQQGPGGIELKLGFVKIPPDLFGHMKGPFKTCLGKEDHEFLTTEPGHHILALDHAFDLPGHEFQDFVSGQVASAFEGLSAEQAARWEAAPR